MCAILPVCGGQKRTFQHRVSTSTVWVLWIKLRLSDLASAFTYIRRTLKEIFCQPQWLIPRILTLRKLRQKDHNEFRTILDYRVRPCKKKKAF